MNNFIEQIINVIDIYHQNRIANYFSKKKIDILIDVGAHKGEFINFFITKNKLKKIYAFEPQKTIYEILQKKTEKIKNIKLYNYACDKDEKRKKFFINILTSTSSFIKPNPKSLWKNFKNIILLKKDLITKIETIQPRKLDNLLFKLIKNKKNIFLKIDVEGSELNVLKGAQKILSSCDLRFIQIESARNISNSDSNKLKLTEFLTKRGFILEKKFIFPLFNFSDDIYIKNKF